MFSVLILIGMVLATVAVDAWVIARLARRIGSPRGRFAIGLFIAILIAALNFGLAVLDRAIPVNRIEGTILLAGLLLIIQLGLIFTIIKRGFALSAKRALLPFGGLLAVQVMYVVVVLAIVRPYILESLHMPTAGMSPTLEPGDRFVVNKLIGLRRFDLVVYWNDAREPLMFCRRLVGMPGEHLRFADGNLHVNDQAIEMPKALAGRYRASVRFPGAPVHYEDGETITLGPDEYFFIGDNVDRSADSRVYGPAKADRIVGVVDLLYMPLSRARIVR
jgi:signal peptidase I